MVQKKSTNRTLLIVILTCFILVVPVKTAALTAIENTEQYTIQPGDTLFSIALSHNTTVDEIMQHNKIENPNRIYIGEILSLPVDKSNYLGGGWSFADETIPGYWKSNERIDGYQFLNDNAFVGLWKNVGFRNRTDFFSESIEKQIEYIKNNPGADIIVAEYGDIKNSGNFAWSSGILYDYSGVDRNSKYIIKTIGSFKYLFLEYKKGNGIFRGIKTAPETKYVVYRKYESVYMVKPGDTLHEIAKAYHTTADAIAEKNNIPNINKIYIFQKLDMATGWR